MRRPLVVALGVVLLLVVGLAAAHGTGQDTRTSLATARTPDAVPPPAPGAAVRNAIVFLVDDMGDIPCDQVETYLPASAPWLQRRGTCYENASAPSPVCCPARAQVQTGQLAHNNGVRTQKDAIRLRADDTVQADLGRAGISTYGIGKNLNGVKVERYYGPDAVDNGFERFDFWNSYRQTPGSFDLYDDDGRPYRPDTGLGSTETTGAFLDAALDRWLASGERFYAYSAFYAPHKQKSSKTDDSALPAVSAANADAPVPPFRYSPELDARDKLGMFATPRRARDYYERLWTARLRAMRDVDDQMAHTFRRLEDAGVLDQTTVVFTSDNGYTDRGQANWDGKGVPYPASTDVPMLAFYPGRPAAVDERAVQLIDIAPTLYQQLGVRPGHRLDGHSLLGRHRRPATYGEFSQENDAFVIGESGRPSGYVRSWRMVKRGRWSYVEWYRIDGTFLRRELYEDPLMLRNVLWGGYRGPPPPAGVVRYLARELARLGRCAGTVENGARNPCT